MPVESVKKRPAGKGLRLGALALLVAAILTYVWLTRQPPLGPFEGRRAPDFSVMNLQGEIVSFADLRGRPLFVNFWATWCVPCRFEMPEIQALYEEHGEKFAVVAVSDEPISTVRKYIDAFDYTFPVYIDGDRSMNAAYRIRALPTSVFIDAEGVIRGVRLGQMNRAQMEAYLDRIVSTSSSAPTTR